MPKIKATKNGFNIQHTTREVFGVDDPPETGEHESDCQCVECLPAGFEILSTEEPDADGLTWTRV